MSSKAEIGKNKHRGLVTDALIVEEGIRNQLMKLTGSIKKRSDMRITQDDMFIIIEIVDRLNDLRANLNEMRVLIIEAREENVIDFNERKAQ